MATYRQLIDELARRCGRYGMEGAADFENDARTALREALDRASVRHPFPWWLTEAFFSPRDGARTLSLPPDCVFVRYVHTPAGRRMRQRDFARVMDFGTKGVPPDSYTIRPTDPLPAAPGGTCAWAQGDAFATGSDTGWTADLEGRVLAFRGDPEWAWIEEVVSPTLLHLSRARRSASADGDHYAIDPSGYTALGFAAPLRAAGAYRMVYSRRPRAPADHPDGDSPDLPEQYHFHYLLWSAYATLLDLTKTNLGSLDRARGEAERCFREMATASAHLLGEAPLRIVAKAP